MLIQISSTKAEQIVQELGVHSRKVTKVLGTDPEDSWCKLDLLSGKVESALMATDFLALRAQVDQALEGGRPQDAVCYLAEIVTADPDDRQARLALAIALGDGGNPPGALKVLRALADHLAHRGLLLAAMVVVRHGLRHAPSDASLISTLKRLHVRGVRAKAGNLPIPPPLKASALPAESWNAERLLELENPRPAAKSHGDAPGTHRLPRDDRGRRQRRARTDQDR